MTTIPPAPIMLLLPALLLLSVLLRCTLLSPPSALPSRLPPLPSLLLLLHGPSQLLSLLQRPLLLQYAHVSFAAGNSTEWTSGRPSTLDNLASTGLAYSSSS